MAMYMLCRAPHISPADAMTLKVDQSFAPDLSALRAWPVTPHGPVIMSLGISLLKFIRRAKQPGPVSL